MILNSQKKNRFPIADWSTYYVVADFDRTITTGSSKTSWSVLAGSDAVPQEYKDERDRLYAIYRPIEIDETLPFEERGNLVKEWFRLHIELFVKYRIEERLFDEAACDLRVMEFRKGAREFLEFLHQKDIPVIIISAGIGNFIEHFLKRNDCYFDNIHISSNKIIFEGGIAVGVEDNIIHSLNKNEISLPPDVQKRLSGRRNVILLGDQTSDLKMVSDDKREEAIKVGFMTEETKGLEEEYAKYFDIVLVDGEDYGDLKDLMIGEN